MACDVCCQGFGNDLPCDCGVINPRSVACERRAQKLRQAIHDAFKKPFSQSRRRPK